MLLKSESTPKIKAIGSNRGDPFAIVPRAPAPAEDSDEAAEAAPIQRLVGELTAPATWEMILAYAADQAGEAAANRGPRRTVAVHERYQRYTEWCATRGHTGVELVIATAVWLSVKPTLKKPEVRAALEPNIVPYHVESHIEHWVLWYHPEATPGATELDAGLFVAHLRCPHHKTRAPNFLVCSSSFADCTNGRSRFAQAGSAVAPGGG